MISYTFSKREKVLLVILAFILIAIAWFVLVYQRTAGEIARIDSEIANVQTAVATDSARVAQMGQMKSEIEKLKAQGAKPVEVPAYDNLQPLMTELNDIMGMTDTYTLSFDEVNAESGDFVRRGVLVTYGCASYDAARAVVDALANGRYPCSIDTASIVDGLTRSTGRTSASTSSAVTASVHVTFFEKR